MEDLGPDSEDEEQDQRESFWILGISLRQITVWRPRPTPKPQLQDQSGLEDSETPQTTGEEESLSSLHTGDLLKDAKFYQDIAIELQTAYETLESRFTQQAHLMEEASGALHAAEYQASKRQQELLKLQKDHEADIQLAVGKVVYEYREQLAAAKHKEQSRDRKHQQTSSSTAGPGLCPRVVVGKPCNPAFSESYQGGGRPVRGDIKLSPRHSQHTKGCGHL